MANLQEVVSWDAGIYQLETSDQVLGGPGGTSNKQAQALANRTAYLKKHVDDLEDGTTAAGKANKLATARNIALAGDVTGQAAFDGTGNISIAVTYKNSGVVAGTYRSVTVDAKGNITAGSNPTTLVGYGITDALPATGTAAAATKLATARTIALAGDVTGQAAFDGTGNISIAVTYKNSGVVAGTYRSVTVDGKGNITAGTNPTTLAGYGITDALPATGTAAAATKLATARTIALAGDVTGQAAFDGTGNISIAVTYKNSGVVAGTYRSVTVDGKGNITAGTNPTTLAGYGITDALPATGTAAAATKLAAARQITVGSSAKNFDGSANIAFSLAEMGLLSAALRDVGVGAGNIPDMSAFSLSQLGAFKLPTGHIVQMDSGPVTGGGFSKSFPTPFPTSVIAMIGIAYGVSGFQYSAVSNISDRRAANINFVDQNGNALSGVTVGYIAIGY